jgi:rubrerythrin
MLRPAAMAIDRLAPVDQLLRPVHRWIWGDVDRRVRKLLAFAEVETGGGRDILRAAEVTPDPLLRRLYLEHAIDELHHGDLFRQRGAALLRAHSTSPASRSNNPLPGGHGLEDLHVEVEGDERVLAFLHVAEKAAAGRFAVYREVVDDDPATRAIFEKILRDEVFHMNYTYMQLTRVAPGTYRKRVWLARGTRLWKRYLSLALALADLIGTVLLTLQYFILLPPFAWLARRAARREPLGWTPIQNNGVRSSTSQY